MIDNPLGKNTHYPAQYDPTLLFAIERSVKRRELGLSGPALPFNGRDLWTAFEVSWLNSKGKPSVAILEIDVDCTTPNIVESKSVKLYLNSFNQERLSGPEALIKRVRHDLTAKLASDRFSVRLFSLEQYQTLGLSKIEADSLDNQDIIINEYTYNPLLLQMSKSGAPVEQHLYSDLLKSNCLITSQPDWATVYIAYSGYPIDHAGLLKYLISFRSHDEFHEQCVERIFNDIWLRCKPDKLTVAARYTRRGGVDINPWRSSFLTDFTLGRLARQ